MFQFLVRIVIKEVRTMCCSYTAPEDATSVIYVDVSQHPEEEKS